jgi:DNA-binding transcriptional regulator YbjK
MDLINGRVPAHLTDMQSQVWGQVVNGTSALWSTYIASLEQHEQRPAAFLAALTVLGAAVPSRMLALAGLYGRAATAFKAAPDVAAQHISDGIQWIAPNLQLAAAACAWSRAAMDVQMIGSATGRLLLEAARTVSRFDRDRDD